MIDFLSNFRWTVLLTDKNAQTIKNSLQNIIITSKRPQYLIETDDEKKCKKFFTEFLIKTMY